MTEAYISALTLQAENTGFSAAGNKRTTSALSRFVPRNLPKNRPHSQIHRDEIPTARAKGKSPALKSHKTPQTFSDVASEWLTVRMHNKAENYLRTVHFRLNKYILPALGSLPIKDITSGLILQVCPTSPLNLPLYHRHRLRRLWVYICTSQCTRS